MKNVLLQQVPNALVHSHFSFLHYKLFNFYCSVSGSTPKALSVFQRSPPEVKDMVQTYRDVFDFEDLHDMVDESKAVAVVGGGFLGSELACALARYGKKKGLKVYQIFKETGNMGKILPEYLSLWTTKKVEAEGVTVLANSKVVDAFVGERKLNLILNNGERVSQ